MKVMLLNGSPHEAGCTYTALMEVAKRWRSGGRNGAVSAGQKPGGRLHRLRGLR